MATNRDIGNIVWIAINKVNSGNKACRPANNIVAVATDTVTINDAINDHASDPKTIGNCDANKTISNIIVTIGNMTIG